VEEEEQTTEAGNLQKSSLRKEHEAEKDGDSQTLLMAGKGHME